MNMNFLRKLPTPLEIKTLYPLNENLIKIKEKNDKEIQDVFLGKSDKLILVIGPCSADIEDAVLDYVKRLKDLQEKVKDALYSITQESEPGKTITVQDVMSRMQQFDKGTDKTKTSTRTDGSKKVSSKDGTIQVPKSDRKLTKRTLVATFLILLLIPLTIYIGVFYLGDRKYYFTSILIMLETLIPINKAKSKTMASIISISFKKRLYKLNSPPSTLSAES